MKPVCERPSMFATDQDRQTVGTDEATVKQERIV